MKPNRKPANDLLIGNKKISGNIIMAPMDGFTDHPYRVIAQLFGSGMFYTEFIDAMGLLDGDEETLKKIYFTEEDTPIAIQLLSDNVETILKSAIEACKYQPDFIDVNMGCSSKSISNRGAGVGLMKNPLKVANIFHSLTREIDIPILGKIRLGWDDASINYPEIVRIIEENGGSLVAIHGRTKSQKYSGLADWDAIAHVKQLVSIPVLGSGDINSLEDIYRMIGHTGCDGVLIGRHAIGNPWIFAKTDKCNISALDIYQTIIKHLDHMINFYGAEDGIIYFRKHLSRYLSHMQITKTFRKQILTCTKYVKLIDFLKRILF